MPAENWFDFENIRIATRFMRRLPRYLNSAVDETLSHEAVQNRLRRREFLFLSKLEKTVFNNPSSPYQALFHQASCTFDDVAEATRQKGVEGALIDLLKAGVFLRVEEFKGRSRIERSKLSKSVHTNDFRNPLSGYHVPASSGGSRSSGTPVLFDLEFIRACAMNSLLVLKSRDGLDWIKTTWEVPGGGARFRLLKYALFGEKPSAWFSQVNPAEPGLHPLYSWSLRAMRWGSILNGTPLPSPQYCPVNRPERLRRWLDETRASGKVPHIFTFPSSAVALAEHVLAEGGDLDSVQFTISGEPITRARLHTLEQAGAGVGPRYGSVECGPIGYGCLNATDPDEMHVQSDLHALIQAGEAGTEWGFGPNSLFITSLHPQSPFVFLNASMGDEATSIERSCGCSLEAIGWTRKLSRIRSYEKLTSAGMTFAGTDVIRVLEEEMPSVFGGAPTDYQLLEKESPSGRSVLRLLVHPRLGEIPAEKIREAFLSAMGEHSIVNRLMEKSLREADVLTIERTAPRLTKQGKILHFHLLRGPEEPVTREYDEDRSSSEQDSARNLR